MAQGDKSRAQKLVEQPSESLATEIKTWIDPDTPKGQAILVKALLALRNHGGGQLLIGINDKSLMPDPGEGPAEVRKAFHVDKIQALVTRFASEPFEIAVEFGERDHQCLPVLFVPAGVRTPVATKSELKNETQTLVPLDALFVRTLRTNNTPSTARATSKDWAALMDVCFENREADIGRFFRRHLAGITSEGMRLLADVLSTATATAPPAPDRVDALLTLGEQRFAELVAERGLTLPTTGYWSVACVIEGVVPPHAATTEFMNLLASSNPRYTGWPVWLDSRNFTNESARPFVFQDTWQALLVEEKGGWRHIDFYWWDPRGTFYVRRALQDDLADSERAPEPNTQLDFGLQILRCTEAIAVALAFAKGMGCDPETTTLQFGFRWTGLKGRQLSDWAQSSRRLHEQPVAQQDMVKTTQSVPLSTPQSAIGSVLVPVLEPLFRAFGGFVLSRKIIEEMATELVERRIR
jgi:hypothetical protein